MIFLVLYFFFKSFLVLYKSQFSFLVLYKSYGFCHFLHWYCTKETKPVIFFVGFVQKLLIFMIFIVDTVQELQIFTIFFVGIKQNCWYKSYWFLCFSLLVLNDNHRFSDSQIRQSLSFTGYWQMLLSVLMQTHNHFFFMFVKITTN